MVETVEAFVDRYPVGLISLMDHTPGQRQFRDLAKYFTYYGGKTGKSRREIEVMVERKTQENAGRSAANPPALVARPPGRGLRQAAEVLAEHGVLDILSSDYVPGSLLMAAFDLPRRVPAITLPQAVAAVSLAPARATGLGDRGEIAPGKRADLVRVQVSGGVPVVRRVWREGRRVA